MVAGASSTEAFFLMETKFWGDTYAYDTPEVKYNSFIHNQTGGGWGVKKSNFKEDLLNVKEGN